MIFEDQTDRHLKSEMKLNDMISTSVNSQCCDNTVICVSVMIDSQSIDQKRKQLYVQTN